jgi:hypothetical protein
MKKLCVVLFIVSCLVCAARAEDATETKGSLPPPEKTELKMNELKAQLVDLDGKVIETIINCVFDFQQVKGTQYRASCGYYASDDGEFIIIPSESVLIPEKGKELFQELAKKTGGGPFNSQRVYLQVRGKRLEAVGTRYSKNKGEYSW